MAGVRLRNVRTPPVRYALAAAQPAARPLIYTQPAASIAALRRDMSVATFAFVMPLVPGKEETDAEMLRRMGTPGPEHDAYAAARRSQGLTREAVWHQKTPMGTFEIIVLEGDDIAASFGRIVSSDEPFAVQLREFVRDVHNVDLAKDPPPQPRQRPSRR